MASFSFGSGNAAKLMRAPLYAIGRLATLVIPRGRRWVFGCGAGIGDGPLALWRVAAADGVDAVWLVRDDAEERAAAAQGIPTLRRDSLRGFWATARARVLVVAYGLGDVNPYAVSGAFVVQLWHGIPLKRIGLDSPETLRSPIRLGAPLIRRLLGVLYRAAQRRIDVLPAASHLVRGRLESAFGLPHDRVVVTGEPRVDALSAGSPEERRARATRTIEAAVGEVPGGRRRLLYAPTWRDGAPDPAVPTPADWVRIVEALERHDAVLFVRSHRLGAGDYVPPVATDRVRALGADALPDITAALPGFDVLVTDYSSLAFDAALVPLPVLYLAPDEEEYAARRGFYGTYADVAGDDPARSWPELLDQLGPVLADPESRAARIARSEALSARVHAYRDGRNTRRLYDIVRARLDRRDVPVEGSE
ncbi:CDP-glycerol glycerophosphotransferase family protein [Microbacterium sediminis]|uniref:Glycosyl/glycerophosphate transferase n=1 Tax=Microbacterium sediminis TaxID=904291 RepID=A0A1B9NG53_9MICO|nr:CDP-glycerol glycerophosphotransferase family protein [Microbacterium sediminis]OCG75576.1 glycosyl/glycerophosphate transferase [Microbacterium sediminis]QBR73974.1 glycosyl/glycerophosphate transferase [Microbacterium sediminis]